ncbi:RHS repeat-associated core domain-containing protein [Amycolatopsis sp. NPDC047767]|uniref:RHS repeat-associated core domain-containing protein n=1 Tax=Amycolatopsis sp. NPDC047767 TaxID=3156765 RepID=UPI00345288C5
MSNPLIVPTKDSTKAYSGISLLEDANSLAQGIESGDWASVAMGAVGTGLDMLSAAMDPFGAALAAGVGWLLEHVGPLKEALNGLTGNADQIQAQSETLANVAKELGAVATDLTDEVNADLQSWSGAAADAYRQRAQDLSASLQAAAKGCEGAASGVKKGGEIVAAVRTLVRDIISQLIGHMISWALQVAATLGIGLSWVIPEVAENVAKTATQISKLVTSLVKALKALAPMLKKTGQLFEDVGKGLKDIKGGKIAGPGKTGELSGTPKAPPAKSGGGDTGGGTKASGYQGNPKDYTPPPGKSGADDGTHASGYDGSPKDYTPPAGKTGGADEATKGSGFSGGGSKDYTPPPGKAGGADEATKASGYSGGGSRDYTPPPAGKAGGADEGTKASGYTGDGSKDSAPPAGSKAGDDATHASKSPDGTGAAGDVPSFGGGSRGLPKDDSTGTPDTKSLKASNADPHENSTPVKDRTDCGDPIDVATGWMMLTQTDLVVPGALPLEVSRTHLSCYRAGRFFGPTWASTVDQRIEVGDDGLHIALADGSIQTYPVPADDPVLPVAGPARSLSRFEGGYLVTDDDQSHSLFFTDNGSGVCPLTTIGDGDGNRIEVVRDENGVPVAMVHSSGTSVLFDSADGRITALRAQDGTVLAAYSYDARGRLTEIVDQAGTPTRFTYDADGRIIRWEDVNGRWYGYGFDSAGRVVRASGTGGYLDCTIEYDRERLVTTVTDSLGAVRRFHLDDRLDVIAETDPLGHTTTFLYDEHGRLLTRTDPLGRQTRWERDEAGRVTAVTAPDGTRSLTEYNELGRPSAAIGPDGATWRYEYNERGKAAAVVDPLGARTTFDYDERGNLTLITDALGGTTRIESDPAGRPLTVVDEEGAVVRYTYDDLGRTTSVTDQLGAVTRYRWAGGDEPAEVIGPDGATWQSRDAAAGNTQDRSDPRGNRTRTEYAQFDLPVAETGPDGQRIEFAYDTELRLVSMTNEQGFVWRYEYDAAGNLVRETDFNGRTLTYRYDAVGDVIARTNGAGETTQLERDAMGRVVRRTTGSDVATFAYDSAGRLVAARNADAEVTFAYDALGRVVAETIDGRPVRSEYDALGRRGLRRTPSGAESSFDYGPAGTLVALRAAGRTIGFDHDLAGRERVRRFGAVELRQSWDSGDHLTAQSVVAGARTTQHREYSYLADGYLTSVADALSGPRTFEVDRSGRVRSVAGHGWQESYAYHSSGAIAQAQTPGTPSAGPREYRGTLLASAGALRFAHDPEGRTTLRGTGAGGPQWQFRWNAESRLTAVVTPNGEHWHYRYDALGRRVAKQRLAADGRITEQVQFAWDGGTIAEQVHSGPGRPQVATVWEFSPDTGRALAQTQRVLGTADERFHAIVTDLVGAPSELVDERGEVAWHRQATLWGKVLSAAGGATTPLRFPGQYHDAETGLHYNVNRYYDPETGRYLSHDPLGLDPGPDSQAYVLNPTALADPLGLMPKATPCAAAKKKAAKQGQTPYTKPPKKPNPPRVPPDGTYGKTKAEQKRLNNEYYDDMKNDPTWPHSKPELNGDHTHQSEHPIGYHALAPDFKRGESATAKRIEDDAPAYQESFQAHRDNIGTGNRVEPDGSGVDARGYRESLENSVQEGRPGNAIQMNQLTYANQHMKPVLDKNPNWKSYDETPDEPRFVQKTEPNPAFVSKDKTPNEPERVASMEPAPERDSFRPTASTTQGRIADDSYHRMVDHMRDRPIEYSDRQGGTTHTPGPDVRATAEMHLARDTARSGHYPTQAEEDAAIERTYDHRTPADERRAQEYDNNHAAAEANRTDKPAPGQKPEDYARQRQEESMAQRLGISPQELRARLANSQKQQEDVRRAEQDDAMDVD